VEAHRVARGRGSHIFWTALRAGALYPPRKIPGTHFSQRLSGPQGHSAAGRIRSIEKSNDLIGIRSRDLPACSIVPQPTTPHYLDFTDYTKQPRDHTHTYTYTYIYIYIYIYIYVFITTATHKTIYYTPCHPGETKWLLLKIVT
jgi:hypothetical protein